MANMRYNPSRSKIYVPGGGSPENALAKTTHMAFAAHPDDIEIMAYNAVEECFFSDTKHFFAVVMTNGADSGKGTESEIIKTRAEEQRRAAEIGRYEGVALLGYASTQVKRGEETVTESIAGLLEAAHPDKVFTHNPADKHDTHVATALRVIEAVRLLPKRERPKELYGMEVWRGLDWMRDADKTLFGSDMKQGLAASLLEVFHSQIDGGKDYVRAVIGRRTANAVFSEPYSADGAKSMMFAMDLTPLIKDDSLGVKEYVWEYIKRFEDDVMGRIERFS